MPNEAADLLVVNAHVFVGGDPRSISPPPDRAHDAVAVSDGRIAWVGRSADARPWRGHGTEVLDARGGLVAPGFEDAHLHLLMGAESLLQADLTPATDVEELGTLLRAWQGAHPDAPWLIGRGWQYGIFPGGMPEPALLDRLVPDQPAALESFDGHTHWLNGAALVRVGITRETSDPPGGVVERDPMSREPTGILKELGEWLHTGVLPEPDDEALDGALRAALGIARRHGLTAIQEAWTEIADLRRYARLRERESFDLRLRVALPADPLDWADGLEHGRTTWAERLSAYSAELDAAAADEWLNGGIVKAFADGVIESGTGWMLAPYEPGASLAGDPAGRSPWPPGSLTVMTTMAVERGWQVEIHAIGDGAIRAALDAHEAAGRAAGGVFGPGRAPGHGRVEHVEWPDPRDLPRFASLEVVASMQPTHALPVPHKLEVRLRQIGRRVERAWPWTSILRSGGVVAFGSDWPIATIDPLRQVGAAVDGARQRLTLAEALACATWGSAVAAGAHDRRGSLEPGRQADIVVLDRDPLEEGSGALEGTSVIATICGGRVVYRAAQR